MKRTLKISLDVLMYGIFLYLMSYQPGRGLFLHGVWGCILFALFLLHHVINGRWYGTLLRGKYVAMRIFFNGINALLFIAMVGMAISSVLMSGDVFTFSPFYQTQTARSLHVASTAWGFILMSLHVGLHLHAPLSRLRRKIQSRAWLYAYYAGGFGLFIAGMVSFAQSSLWHSMLLLRKSSMPLSPLEFYSSHVAITMAACIVVHLLIGALQRRQQKLASRARLSRTPRPPVRSHS